MQVSSTHAEADPLSVRSLAIDFPGRGSDRNGLL
jgi:hypothetical protein